MVGDPNKIIVAGDSAGGNLAAAVTVEAHRTKYRDFNLIYQVLVYPGSF